MTRETHRMSVEVHAEIRAAVRRNASVMVWPDGPSVSLGPDLVDDILAVLEDAGRLRAKPISASTETPEVGQVWREKRRPYEKRTVEVVAVDQHFVKTRTITGTDGKPPSRAVTSRTRRPLWDKTFVPYIDSNDAGRRTG